MSTVAMLLKRFPEKGIVQVTPSNTIVEAITVMKRLNISSLLIIDDEERFVGILSERDIAWKVVLTGLNPKTTKVGQVMTPRSDIVTVFETTTLKECLDAMKTNNVRHLPVMKNGEPIGVVSLRDIALTYDLLVDSLTAYVTGRS